jgi:diguanylate cyclase (GGDEF)-like protein
MSRPDVWCSACCWGVVVLAEAEWDRFRRHERPLSLLMIDIDHFKSINDRFGHDVGDRLIVQINNACRDQKRKSDIVARLGGEEFALLLPETPLEAAQIAAERLRDAISRNVLALPDSDIAVTASVGISSALEGGSLKTLLKHADLALYQAKRDGRNRVCAFDPAGPVQDNVEYLSVIARA